jgi:hypothetical protein
VSISRLKLVWYTSSLCLQNLEHQSSGINLSNQKLLCLTITKIRISQQLYSKN